MSFKQLKKDILFQVAEDFAVDLEGDKDDITKDQIIAALAEDGVTWDMYKEAYPDEKDQDDATVATTDDEPVDEDDEPEVDFKKPVSKVLLKMTRSNGTYQIRGYKFTSAHPFLPVAEEDANYILENIEGFKIASPREAEEFYS